LLDSKVPCADKRLGKQKEQAPSGTKRSQCLGISYKPPKTDCLQREPQNRPVHFCIFADKKTSRCSCKQSCSFQQVTCEQRRFGVT